MDRNVNSIPSAALERCERLFAEDRFTETIAQTTAALRDDPENLDLLRLRSLAYGLEAEFEKSLSDADMIIALAPREPQSYVFRAATRLQDEMAEVLDDVNMAIELDPEANDAYVMMSAYWFAHFNLEKIDTATASAVHLAPENHEALNLRSTYLTWRGLYAESQNLYDKCLNSIEKLLESGRRDHDLLSYYATMLSIHLEDEKSLAVMEEGIRRFPKMPYFLIQRAEHHLRWGRIDQAELDLDAAKEILDRYGMKDSRYFLTRSDFLDRKEDWKSSIEQLKMLLEWMPDNPSALERYLTQIKFLASNDEEEGKKTLEMADHLCEMIPNYSHAFILRYSLLMRDGKQDEAMSDLEHAMRTLPQNASDRSWAAYYLIEAGGSKIALDLLNKVIEEEPENIHAIGMRGIAWNGLGACDCAIHDLNFALEKGGDNVQLLEERGKTWLELGRFGFTRRLIRRAIDDFSNALEIKPKNANLWWLRGLGWYRFALRTWFGKKPALEKAIHDFSESIRISPDNPDIWQDRALAHWKNADYEATVDDCTEAINRDPNYADAVRLRALAYRRLNKLEESKRDENKLDRILDSY